MENIILLLHQPMYLPAMIKILQRRQQATTLQASVSMLELYLELQCSLLLVILIQLEYDRILNIVESV